MRRIRLLWRILKITHADKLLFGFLVYFILTSIMIYLVEPNIQTVGDSLWYCFAASTTIGFGDIVAVTLLGRVLTVILCIYAVLIIALIPGVVVSYFIEFNKIKSKESVVVFLDQLEHLETLSKEELRELSQKVKQRRYRL
ncbi:MULTISPECIES: potassium channel family protein [Clostridiaceae]|uniref:Two pore domain potassium channel family protein n=1 Tax=Clostridium facile TaxID=2763035 RepID=A0ABR7IN94_9CLOT|nr:MULTISPECIES: potassium channel family protein [Clostridiaceae]MBC5786604.1 two pore domain potassium channel family protein [Clostridium facile]PWN00145.1 MAG: two pore domain potassium channel family protein [Massilioclostridium sp.]